MTRNKLYIVVTVLLVLVALFCLAIISMARSISTPYRTNTQQIQVTNDTAHNLFVLRNLNTGEALTFSSRNTNLPASTAKWTDLTYYYPCEADNSKYHFSGRVFIERSTQPVDSSGAYLFALVQASNAIGKYNQRFGWTSGWISGIHSLQWDVSVNDTNGKTHLVQAAPDRTININPGGYPISFGYEMDSLQPVLPFTPNRTTLKGKTDNLGYQETWSNNSFWDRYAIWYPYAVPIQGVTTWYVSANATVTWTWNWSVQYK